MPFTCVVTDHGYENLEPEERVLRPIGVELVDASGRDRASLRKALAAADAVLSQYLAIDAETIRVMARCLAVVRYGVGFDSVDLAAATEAGICVANVPDYGTQEVALHAMALLLAVHRRLSQYDAETRQGRWIEGPDVVPRIHRMSGRTLGIVGLGRIGKAVAALAAPLGLHVLAYDPYVTRTAAIEAGAVLVDYATLLRQSDFVTFHTPLNAETRHLLSEAEIRLMKPDAVLVNTSRGAVVDTAALARALREGRLAGAGLDVFEGEPLSPQHPLRSTPNTLLTPHVAWYSQESEQALKRMAAEEVARVARGEWPRSVVNPEVRANARLTPKTKT
jgi:D-3-phosphoglycerate dehydrogenase / 2-oxoglutarate reductase